MKKQTGGDHYSKLTIQPMDVAKDWLSQEEVNGACILSILKYLSRYKSKGGLEDLKKARDYLDELIDNMSDETITVEHTSNEIDRLRDIILNSGDPSSIYYYAADINNGLSVAREIIETEDEHYIEKYKQLESTKKLRQDIINHKDMYEAREYCRLLGRDEELDELY